MMSTHAFAKKLAKLTALGLLHVAHSIIISRMLCRVKKVGTRVLNGLLVEPPRSLDSVFSRVNKDHDLMTSLKHLLDLLEGDLLQVLSRLHGTGLAFRTEEVLLERDGAEGSIEVEQASHLVHAKEVGNVDVVRERGRQTNNPDQGLCALHLSLCPCHQTLQHSATLVVQHVDFINDEQPHLLHELGIACAFTCDDVPLFWCCDDDLRIKDLGFSEMHVSSQFARLDAQPGQTLAELLCNFSGQRFHGRYVDDLEVFQHDGKVGCFRLLDRIGYNVLSDSIENGQHCSIRFTSTSGRANEHVFARLVCHRIHQALHAVKRLVALEGPLTQTV